MRAPRSCRSKLSIAGLIELLEDVVSQHHEDAVAAREPLSQAERVGDSALALLIRIREPVDSVCVAVAEQPEELPGVRAPRHEHELADPGRDDRLDRIRDHRPVVDRQQVLVRDPRQRMEAAPCAAGEDDALHIGEIVWPVNDLRGGAPLGARAATPRATARPGRFERPSRAATSSSGRRASSRSARAAHG